MLHDNESAFQFSLLTVPQSVTCLERCPLPHSGTEARGDSIIGRLMKRETRRRHFIHLIANFNIFRRLRSSWRSYSQRFGCSRWALLSYTRRHPRSGPAASLVVGLLTVESCSISERLYIWLRYGPIIDSYCTSLPLYGFLHLLILPHW